MSSASGSITLRCLSVPQAQRPLVPHLRGNAILPHRPSPGTVVALARRRDNVNFTTKSSKRKKWLPHNDVAEEEDLGEDALEALFSQLEELENNDPSLDDGDGETGVEDLANRECQLAEALEKNDLLGSFDSPEDDGVINESEDDADNDDDTKELAKLKNWQLRRLAYALKNGRRKISIQNLAADVCLDRAVILQLLRDPPPNLLLMSATLPDKPISPTLEPQSEPLEIVSSDAAPDVKPPESKVEVPVHVMQSSWSVRKRLKKVQVGTLETVYARTKRPTNAMVSSIVHLTNLPRKKVIKWFEDKRTEDGVHDNRVPYQRRLRERGYYILKWETTRLI